MKTANQLTFTTYEASLKLNPSDPIKVIFDNIDWSFIHRLVKERYKISPKGADGYDPISLFKAQLLIYLGEVSSDRKLASALRYNVRLCLLCDFNFLKTPSNGTFTNFRDRLGEELFYEILHRLIAQAIAFKVIHGGDTAIDSTHLWAYSSKFGKKSCQCQGECHHPREYSDPDARWGYKNKDYIFFGYKVHLIVDAKSQLPLDVKVTSANEADSPQAKPLLKGTKERHPEVKIDSSAMDSAYDSYENYRFVIEDIGAAPIIALNHRGRADAITQGSLYLSGGGKYTCVAGFEVVYYRLIGSIPRGTSLWQERYNARTSVERAYAEEKGSHHLANPRVRGLSRVRIHVYLTLCAQVIKRIGAMIMERFTRPHPTPCSARA